MRPSVLIAPLAALHLLLLFPAEVWSRSPETAIESEAIPVEIHIDAAQRQGELVPFWRFFGADEPNYAYMQDGAQLLTGLGKLRPGSVYFRTHNLLTSGDGTPALKWGSTGAYRENKDNQPVYDWTIVDRIFSTYLDRGVRPYVQIGFMPKELSTHPEPDQHHWTPTARYEEIYTGWSYPPKDYDKWQELVFRWTEHCVERFGRREVAKWYWETWNEANIGYWRGTPEEFFKLHDHAIAGVKRALPEAKVGGPDVAGHGGQFMRDFLNHCLRGKNYATGKVGTPIDFISFHAKGSPQHIDGHVRMGISNQLRTVDEAFQIIASFPELKNKPVVIGECDPEGCAACQGPQLNYRNTTMYSSYTAASFARIRELADRRGINLEGVLTWAFEFEDQPSFAGFRVLSTNGIGLPVLNVFRMFSRMSGERLLVTSSHSAPLSDVLKTGVRERPDISAIASLANRKLYLLVWYYHDDDAPGPDANVVVAIENMPTMKVRPSRRRLSVDEEHGNAYTAWRRMGAPLKPTPEQYTDLQRQSELSESTPPTIVESGDTSLTFSLQLSRRGVALVEIDLPR